MSKQYSKNDDLWRILVDTAHALPMYKGHRRYVETVMFKENPAITGQELAIQLNIPLGEALVLLDEVSASQPNLPVKSTAPKSQKTTNRSLLDFG